MECSRARNLSEAVRAGNSIGALSGLAGRQTNRLQGIFHGVSALSINASKLAHAETNGGEVT
jgi:hypothetical protein